MHSSKWFDNAATETKLRAITSNGRGSKRSGQREESTENVSVLRCITMAFRRSSYLEFLYDHGNATWFGGKLPRIHVGWDRERFDKRGERDKAAITEMYHDNRDCRIVFNSLHRLPFVKFDTGIEVTLLHEMLHVKLSEYQCKSRADLHGKRFKAERQRLIDAGAFTELL